MLKRIRGEIAAALMYVDEEVIPGMKQGTKEKRRANRRDLVQGVIRGETTPTKIAGSLVARRVFSAFMKSVGK